EVSSVLRGELSGATATIERVNYYQDFLSNISEFVISNIDGEFLHDEFVYIDDQYYGKIVSDGVQQSEGYYLTDHGFPSSTKKLQDSYYYQDYSYEVISSKSLVDYETVLKDLVHPV